MKGSQEYAQETLLDNLDNLNDDSSIGQEMDIPENDLEMDNEDKGIDIDV